MSAGESVRYETGDKVALITISRPARRNSLDREAASQLAACWRRFEASDERVAVVTGEGNVAFCAGIDLSDPPDASICLPGAGVTVTKPIIAAVSGWAVGFGVALTMVADLAVAARNSTFMYPESKVGYTGGLVASLAVRIAYKHAMEMMLLGDAVDAERARTIGLVNRIVDDGAHVEQAMIFARQMAEHAPLVTRALKRLALATLPSSPAELAAGFRASIAEIEVSEDRREGALAMAEKRAPRFGGR